MQMLFPGSAKIVFFSKHFVTADLVLTESNWSGVSSPENSINPKMNGLPTRVLSALANSSGFYKSKSSSTSAPLLMADALNYEF